MVRSGHGAAGILSGAFTFLARHFLSGFRLAAGTVWPVSAPPITNGAILVDSTGRIAAVGADQLVPRPPSLISYSAATGVLLPGLVNTHTHLELTHLRGSNVQTDFYAWIQEVRRGKAAVSAEGFLAAARDGVREAWAAGITTVADTGDSGAVAAALTGLGGRGVVYQEVFGPHPDQADESLRLLRSAVDRLRATAGSVVTVGVSPHAPYTVSPALFRLVSAYAGDEELPLAVHLAESHAETALLARSAGPFADMWRERHIPLPPVSPSPVRYLDGLGVIGSQTLVIHGVQVDQADAELLAARGAAVALCPRSNERHGHGLPPVDRYIRAGVRIGAGTDSVVSVDSLDLFADARVLAALGGLDVAATVELLTLGGARALGMQHEIGSLEAGKLADLCLVEGPLTGGPGRNGGHSLLASPAAVKATWVGGRLVYGSWPGGR